MSWLTQAALYVVHAIYLFVDALSFLLHSLVDPPPRPLDAERKQIPKHLALIFATGKDPSKHALEQLEDYLVDNVERAVSWCRLVGINTLSIYDHQGILSKCSVTLKKRLLEQTGTPQKDSDEETEFEYPLTPPLTDESRSLSPDHGFTPTLHVTTINTLASREKRKDSRRAAKRRQSTSRKEVSSSIPLVTLHILSRDSGKPAIASVANSLLLSYHASESGDFKCSIEDITSILEGDPGFPEPDLIIVHETSILSQRKALELYGFPPWQLRLSEILHSYHRSLWPWRSQDLAPLNELDFRRALDTYSSAEFRVGK